MTATSQPAGPASRAALVSIHPEFAARILVGEKQVEFRRRALGAAVKRLVIYATAPIGAIVGAAGVQRVVRGTPLAIWQQYAKVGGIDRKRFFEYFDGSTDGFAYSLVDAVACEPFVALGEGGLPRRPPQSFQYLSPSIVDHVLSRAVAIEGARAVASKLLRQ